MHGSLLPNVLPLEAGGCLGERCRFVRGTRYQRKAWPEGRNLPSGQAFLFFDSSGIREFLFALFLFISGVHNSIGSLVIPWV